MNVKHDLKPHEYFVDPVRSTKNENLIQLRIGIDWYKNLWNKGRRSNVDSDRPCFRHLWLLRKSNY